MPKVFKSGLIKIQYRDETSHSSSEKERIEKIVANASVIVDKEGRARKICNEFA